MGKEDKTALIVDDEEIMLDIESFMLQKIGFNTLKAINSVEACRLYEDKKEHIDIVVLDMCMPDENGTGTYKRLKRMNPNIIAFKKKILGLNDSKLWPSCCKSQRVRGLHFSNH